MRLFFIALICADHTSISLGVKDFVRLLERRFVFGEQQDFVQVGEVGPGASVSVDEEREGLIDIEARKRVQRQRDAMLGLPSALATDD